MEIHETFKSAVSSDPRESFLAHIRELIVTRSSMMVLANDVAVAMTITVAMAVAAAAVFALAIAISSCCRSHRHNN